MRDVDEPDLVTAGLAILCAACESEIEIGEDDHGLCRHCGVAFLVDATPAAGRVSRAGA